MRSIKLRSQENAKSFSRALVVFLIFITFAVIGFFYCVDKNIEEIVVSTITKHVERQSCHIKSVLDIRHTDSENTADFSTMLLDDFYDGEGEHILVAEDGTVPYYDGDGRLAQPEGDFYSYFKKVKFRQEVTLDNVRADFQDLKSGCVIIGEGREVCYMAYAPIGHDRWMLCYIVPVLKAQEEYQSIRKYELILAIILALAAMGLLVRVFRISDRQMQEISKNALTDALTGAFNKKGAEDQINDWLSGPDCKGVQALLMLDVDKFKEINDVYGHYMGDRVIRQVGRTLRKEFRDSDIIGRIGGDEFVIFMKNVGSSEMAVNRGKYILERFRKMKLPEIQENNITCSMGLAFSPDHGVTYKELYGNADKALYNTKRNGKDGITVFGTDIV